MRRIALAAACVMLVTATAAVAQPRVRTDARGCKDHPLFTRMPDYWIHHCDERGFDVHKFLAADGKTTAAEGHLWSAAYYPQAATTVKASEIQILRNFEQAVLKLGGKVVASTKGRETLRLTHEGRTVWVDVTTSFTGSYSLTIVEEEAMAQDIVANAASLGNDLKTTGHVAVGGILFDTGKAEIKPESAQAIGEVAKLLAGDPALKVYVVGHTDNVGALDANMKLSQDRAEAVVLALVRTHGIAAARLKGFGNGPYAPIASNDTDAGKAQNRRVELVKQ